MAGRESREGAVIAIDAARIRVIVTLELIVDPLTIS